MRRLQVIALTLLAEVCLVNLVLLSGCMHRIKPGITYFVGAECHPSAKMIGCDQASPPTCRQITLSYDKACERLAAKP